MPHISTAMVQSVRRGAGDMILNSLVGRDSVIDDANSFKNTFSSWNNCMAKTYCKYPVIAGLIIGGLILFSIVWCIIRCACCGMSCCCTCFSFLKCCDCCGGCCDGKKDKPHKYKDDPNSFPPDRGYQAPAPMMGGGLPAAPQFATFEIGKNGLAIDKPTPLHEDALPPMPSWETAQKKHILTEEEKNAVELGELDPATGQQVPLMAGGAGTGLSAPPSPAPEITSSQYGARPSQINADGYVDIASHDPYGQNQNAYNQNSGGYRGVQSSGHGTGDRGDYDTAASGRGYGTSSQVGSGRGYANSEYGSSNRDYAASQPPSGRGYAPSQNGSSRGYGPLSPQDPYASSSNVSRVAYDTGNDNYNGRNQGYPRQPTRQYSGHTADTRPAMNQRQYTDQTYRSGDYQPTGAPRGQARGHLPPASNNSGFDFGTDQYSRPSTQNQQSYSSNYHGGSTAPPSYATRSPPPQEQSYRGYAEGRPAPATLLPGGGRAREPQNWDPVQR